MRTLTVILTLGLSTGACGDDKGTSETTTGSSTGSATGGPTGSSSGTATTGPEVTTGSSTGPGTGDDTTASPTTTTGPEVTTGPDVTTGPGTTTEDTETVPETGVVDGLAVVVEDRCAPDDGPGLEFKVGVTSAQCGAEWPNSEPIVTVSLWQGSPLEPGYYKLEDGGGFASFDDGNGEKTTSTGTISLISWDAGFPTGAIELAFPDGSTFSEEFLGIYCPSEPPCK